MRAGDSVSTPALSPPASWKQIFADDITPSTGTPHGGTAHTGHPDFKVIYPSTIAADPTTPRKLFIFLTSYGSDANLTAQEEWNLQTIAEDENAIVIGGFSTGGSQSGAIKGQKDSTGARYWNATGGCCDGDGAGNNDVAYLGGMIDEVKAIWPIKSTEIYGVGNSAGAFMMNRLASERADIAAVAVDAGAGASVGDAARPYPAHVSILEIHGTSDSTISEAGGTLSAPAMGAAYPADHTGTLQQWATANGCAGSLTDTGNTFDYDSVGPGNETHEFTWTSCPSDGQITHWHQIGVGHGRNPTAAGTAAMVAWLKAHHR